MHGFQLKFYCVRWFRFLHGFVLEWESLLFPLYSLHFQGQVHCLVSLMASDPSSAAYEELHFRKCPVPATMETGHF